MNFKYICIICLIFGIYNLNPVSASVNTVSMDDLVTGLGFTIDTEIALSTSDSYGTGTIAVHYDPATVHVIDVKGSEDSVMAASTIDNVNGSVTISAWNLKGATGDFPFATVTFRAIDIGTSPLDISIEALQDIFYNDILAAASSGSITVNMGFGTSSGSSGGGGASGEDRDNILISETEMEFVNKGSDVSYPFDWEGNVVRYVNFTGVTSSGEIVAIVEILNHTSVFANYAPSNTVYKNLNIWVGYLGWANPGNIANPTVNFKVEKSWVTANNMDRTTIRLNRYSDGKWNQLMTAMNGEDANYLFFEAQTPGFSPFAITGKTTSLSYSSTAPEVGGVAGSGGMEEESVQIPDTTSGRNPVEKQPGFGLFAGVSMLLIAIQILCKKK
ncbi:MAG: PGF-pre-PGF domain-containing protein [ANME-2 cluster archaeon]|nr:MAG: PGF-pre-PGF domain-containing protein [ANME-2 cluster archaeon]